MVRGPISKKQILLVIVDLIIVIGSIFLASTIVIGFDNGLNYIKVNYLSFCLTGCIYIFAFFYSGLYDFRKDFRLPHNLVTIAYVSVIAFIIVTFCFYISWSLRLGRGIYLINGILITLFLISWRYAYSHIVTRPQFQTRTLIVGAGEAGKTILTEIKNSKGAGLKIIAFADDDKTKLNTIVGGVPVLCDKNNLLETMEKYKITQIIVAVTHEKQKGLIKALIKCSQRGAVIVDMPSFYELLTGKVPFDHIDDLWLLNSLTSQSKFHVEKIKRLMDIVLASVLLLLTSPIIPIIVLLIKKGSSGGIFFVQERVGKDAKPFKMFKFRSMFQNAEQKTGAVFASDNDVRITGVGKFLRKWRLDEIPQLINVIKGDMSLVGPRPEREVFISEFQEKIPFYAQRLAVRPGLTGWAQAKYLYSSSFEQTEEKLKYDLYYIKNLSFILDCIILFHTVKVIVFGRGK